MLPNLSNLTAQSVRRVPAATSAGGAFGGSFQQQVQRQTDYLGAMVNEAVATGSSVQDYPENWKKDRQKELAYIDETLQEIEEFPPETPSILNRLRAARAAFNAHADDFSSVSGFTSIVEQLARALVEQVQVKATVWSASADALKTALFDGSYVNVNVNELEEYTLQVRNELDAITNQARTLYAAGATFKSKSTQLTNELNAIVVAIGEEDELKLDTGFESQ